MNTIVVYSSKYGSTKKYAEWIADELKCDLKDKKDITIDELLKYDAIVYGGGLYAGGVNGIDIFTKQFDKLKNKKLILFTCGISDPKLEENVNNIRKNISKSFNDEMMEKIKIFHLRGSMDYSKLSLKHSMMMKMLKAMILKKDKSELSEEDKQIIDTYGTVIDFTDKETIKPIIEYLDK
ncbi:MAG: flavodoxin domain-containing protein [Candidatus Metalachnospira sp.]|nr:flavodoxin domain-containing protein [Candidatus Metalachnospira sp.]